MNKRKQEEEGKINQTWGEQRSMETQGEEKGVGKDERKEKDKTKGEKCEKEET